ncbi:MAG: AI-2E family transporter [Panacagrimonas sp.]
MTAVTDEALPGVGPAAVPVSDPDLKSAPPAAIETPATTPSIHLPVHVRNTALAVIAVLAIVVMLKWAKLVLIPIALAAFLSYTLRPLAVLLRKHARVPEVFGAGIVLILALGLVVGGAMALEPQATRFLDSMPQATKKLERLVRRSSLDKTGAMQKLLMAADGLERVAANQVSGTAPAGNSSSQPAAEPLNLRGLVWTGTEAMASGLFEAIVVLALCYFLMISSQSFKRKLVRISGSTLRRRKVTVQILDQIDAQVQRYVVIQVLTSALVGVGTGVAFALIGLDNALFWGVMAGVLHLIPYIGTAIVLVASAFFAWLQFDTVNGVLLVVGSGLAITSVIGVGIVPWLTEKVGRINAVVTLVSLIAWEWLWGIPGLLLGIPIMMALLAVCERVDNLNPVAELLSGDASPGV